MRDGVFDFEIVKVWKSVMMEPKKFFSKLKVPAEGGYRRPSVFYLKVTAVSMALVFIVDVIMAVIRPERMAELNLLGNGVLLYVLLLVLLFPIVVLLMWGLLYVSSGIVHLFARMFGARKGFRETFAVNAYSSAPDVFQVIPIVNLAALVYSLVLLVIGLRERQEMSLGGAIACVVIPLLIVLVIVGVLAAAILALGVGDMLLGLVRGY